MHLAAATGNKKVVSILLQSGANVRCHSQTYILEPVHVAVLLNNLEVVNILVENGADLGPIPVANIGALHAACDTGSVELVKGLLELNVNMDHVNYRGETPIFIAMDGKNWIDIAETLLHSGVDINQTTPVGSVLHEVAWKGNTEQVSFLLKKGSDPNIRDFYGRTALHKAVYSNNPDIIILLAESGANLDALDSQGLTPLDYALRLHYEQSADALAAIGRPH